MEEKETLINKQRLQKLTNIICDFGDGKTEFHTRDIEYVIKRSAIVNCLTGRALTALDQSF